MRADDLRAILRLVRLGRTALGRHELRSAFAVLGRASVALGEASGRYPGGGATRLCELLVDDLGRRVWRAFEGEMSGGIPPRPQGDAAALLGLRAFAARLPARRAPRPLVAPPVVNDEGTPGRRA
jgi:hypothetical protein